MSKDLQLFNHEEFGQVRAIKNEEGEPLFNLNDVALSLGYTKVSKGKEYIRKERVDKLIENLDIITVVHGGQLFIDESGLYDFIFESNTDNSRSFRKWVTSDVLPTIRKEGAYISSDITDEQANKIDKKMLYATPQRRRKAIEQATIDGKGNVFEVYQDILEFMKKWKADDKVTALKHIEKVLDDKKASYGTDIAFVAKVEQLVVTVAKDIDKVRNHSYGARLREANKQNKVLEQQVEELKPPSIDEYFVIPKHPFSQNYRNRATTDINGKPIMINTEAYNSWKRSISAFNSPRKSDLSVDFSKPMKLWLAYDQVETMDTTNFEKPVLDKIAELYGFDDVLVQQIGKPETMVNKYVDSLDDGKIYFLLRNVDDREMAV